MPTRRSLLRSLGCLAGAGAVVGSAGGATPERRSSPSVFEFEVDVINPRATREHPPTVRISVTNRGRETYGLETTSVSFPFTGFAPRNVPRYSGVAVYPAWEFEAADRPWTAGALLDGSAMGGGALAPGETVAGEYAVLKWEDPFADESSAHWPAGRYTFLDQYYWSEPWSRNDGAPEDIEDYGGAGAPTEDLLARFEWGFTLSVAADGRVSLAETVWPLNR